MKNIPTFIAQGIAASILLMAAWMKFNGDPASIAIFEALEMEPKGRYLVGVIELSAALLLLSPSAAVGSILAISVMCGALLAHTTRLGVIVVINGEGDGGMAMGLMLITLVSAIYVAYARRKEIPLVGKTL